ncbi:DEAD/DEAH box helicase [Verrucomicrobium sp. 3C]|uniref:DEAD/DEAH box helicase n=1 Tax=Verrucomicrobium sp. 3C TaxID=1134055 RepID=UPI000370284C|nr:DEAD/DEAH box helicase [Verrucomicrobium sp. 3C]
MSGLPYTTKALLRPYQSAALEAIREGWKEARRLLISAPTGSGKTVIFAHAAAEEARAGRKVLVLAHREELLSQAQASLKKFCGLPSSLEQANAVASLKSPVVVASVQTMVRRLSRFPKNHFGLVIVDEAHHSAAGTYVTILDYFSSARVLGATATPFRADEKQLGTIFEKEAYRIGLADLIRQGYLSRLTVDTLPLSGGGIDLAGVSIRKGEFAEEEAADAITPYLEEIAGIIATHYAGRRILAFLPLRATSKSFVAFCRDAGLRAEHVDGESPDRSEILERFRKGETQVLSNAMLLTEGFDCPPVDAILLLRPTRSRVLYQQMIGRGTRLFEGKRDCLILDPCFVHDRLPPLRASSLIAKDAEEEKRIDTAGCKDLLEAAEKAEEARREREETLVSRLQDHSRRIVADYLTPISHQ